MAVLEVQLLLYTEVNVLNICNASTPQKTITTLP